FAATREASRVTGNRFAGFGGALLGGVRKVGLEVLFLLDQAWLSLDAIAIALFRLISGRKRLEWVTMRASAKGSRDRASHRMLLGSVLAAAASIALAVERRETLPYALPLLVAWFTAPFIARFLGEPLVERTPSELLSADDQHFLRIVARKTWRFFDHFVTAAEHYLPPDNYQMDPRGVIARRTSPTNIGLYLLSVLAAHDFGVLTASEVVRRIELTLDTLDKLPHRDGHLLNWYDTESLAPLAPEYVSTVDSGNLAGYLWTLATAANELRRSALSAEAVNLAVADALELAGRALDAKRDGPLFGRIQKLGSALRDGVPAPETDILARLAALDGTRRAVDELVRAADGQALEARYWLGEAERTVRAWSEQLKSLTPFASMLAAHVTLPVKDADDLWTRLGALLRKPGTLEELHQALTRALELIDDGAAAGTTARGEESTVEPSALDFKRALQQGYDACELLLRGLDRLGERCKKLADGMSFGFLLDETRELFSTGYNVNNARLDTSHYDLLASEARLASLIAIAKGDVPQKHWFRLGRPRAKVNDGRSLLSWSGSMFEYLMPLLVTYTAPQSLLDETVRGAVRRQRAYGASRHVPWGISESAYNVMDLQMTYQYRAFGVPGLGLKAGLAEDLVVAPYATALAALVDPVHAVKNLRALSREGLEGPFGYFEAIDYSPTRIPPGKNGVVVRSFMAHHLGMTLVSLDNVLHDQPMARRFHADPRVKASELLLEERIPVDAPLLKVPDAALAAPVRHALDLTASEHVRIADGAAPRAHLLGHGQLSTLVTASGSGALTWKGVDINRFREDAVFDAGGIYAYVRDLSDHRTWSVGYHPTRRNADTYEAAFFIDRVELRRRDGAVETITELVPSAEHPAEIRRFTLKNHGAEALELELTTFTELALAPRGADVAHRAFSSMFIETEALPELGAVIAHRRPRSPDEPTLWVAQVLTPEDEGFGELDYDTSRVAFIGRDGSLDRPHALSGFEGSLGRHVGAVLDPAFVLRRRVRVA
ncbi:MAG TPA: glucoamylase family protein, partial [Polyangiaceae bacterium]|nr:glucoamylase family protein [Polyangiaceae bacterium]